MRLTSLAVLGLFAASVSFAGSRPETTTYIDGTLPGVVPNTGGTLLFTDDNAMFFRTGLTSVPISYAGVTKAELGAVKETNHDVPLYKVWALHKRFGAKTQTQLLIVEFKNEEGDAKTMTLELSQAAAADVLDTIQSHAPQTLAGSDTPGRAQRAAHSAGKSKSTPDSWWGDDFWKTPRNSDKWSKPTGTNAPDNQQ